mmetsp:Transcript_17369/g.47331  ORF Transcript_17369/g.47331 Transcript_17369/m.47331 type:complete len:268 (-) Transcript_17369:424-1227(-)
MSMRGSVASACCSASATRHCPQRAQAWTSSTRSKSAWSPPWKRRVSCFGGCATTTSSSGPSLISTNWRSGLAAPSTTRRQGLKEQRAPPIATARASAAVARPRLVAFGIAKFGAAVRGPCISGRCVGRSSITSPTKTSDRIGSSRRRSLAIHSRAGLLLHGFFLARGFKTCIAQTPMTFWRHCALRHFWSRRRVARTGSGAAGHCRPSGKSAQPKVRSPIGTKHCIVIALVSSRRPPRRLRALIPRCSRRCRQSYRGRLCPPAKLGC